MVACPRNQASSPLERIVFKGFLLFPIWLEISLVEAPWKRQAESRSVKSAKVEEAR